MTWTPPPGTIGLTYSYGFTGFRATIGQAFASETATYSHAFIVLSDTEIIEPWPSGARVTALADYEDDYVAFGFLPDLSPDKHLALATAALSLDGIGHGLLDYLALAATRYGWRCGRRRTASTARLLPAQFAVETYRRSGVELFPGFEPGDVTMDELGALLLTSPEWELRIPCIDFGVRGGRYAR